MARLLPACENRMPSPLRNLLVLIAVMTLPLMSIDGSVSSTGHVVARFGGECSGDNFSPTRQLTRLIQLAKHEAKMPCENAFCDGAFSCDLNGDGKPEHFIRLACGATGNCTWGVFSDRPARLRGTFTAWFIYIHKRKGSWSVLSTYTREGGDQGMILGWTSEYLQH